jgi:hypothetical protein
LNSTHSDAATSPSQSNSFWASLTFAHDEPPFEILPFSISRGGDREDGGKGEKLGHGPPDDSRDPRSHLLTPIAHVTSSTPTNGVATRYSSAENDCASFSSTP